MQLDSDQLWTAIEALATDEPANLAAVAKLIEYGLAERGEQGPRLTAYGERAYVVLESGDGFVPELDEPC